MIASNSLFCPRGTSADPTLSTWMQANNAAEPAVVMNRITLTRLTGTPTYRAAWYEPPTAKIQLPNRVLVRTHVATATARIHHSRTTLNSPPPIVTEAVNSFATGSLAVYVARPLTIVLLVIVLVTPIPAPRRIRSMPSVTMNDGSPVLIRIQPLKAPTASAKANVRMIAIVGGTPNWTMSRPRRRPAAPIIEPTERSNSPAIISNETAAPRMPTWAVTSRNPAAP